VTLPCLTSTTSVAGRIAAGLTVWSGLIGLIVAGLIVAGLIVAGLIVWSGLIGLIVAGLIAANVKSG
jgi:hypothetical protein